MPAVVGPVLTLDAALDGCGVAVVQDGKVLAERREPGGRGSSALLPAMTRSVLEQAGLDATGLGAVAVTVGPGSFTGVRAALALAHGIALGAGIAARGVSVADAIRAVCLGDRPVWVAIDSKRNRVFVDTGETIASHSMEDLPRPSGPVALAGDAGEAVARRLCDDGFDVAWLGESVPTPSGIAAAAARAAVPMYVDPPEARPPVAARPAPAG